MGAALLRGLLRAAEVPYTAAVRWRNAQYDRGKKPIHRASVPVISVGNLSLGGTGKTPMVEWLCRHLRQRGVRVTIISRGYGAEAGSRNDEALELELKLPDVPHLQNPDRVAAAQTAVEEFDCQAIVLDDAFQHRRIHRDLDIVLLDALEPLGHGHVFPRGTLREPPSSLARAHVVALSRADMLSVQQRSDLRRQIARYAPTADWLEVTHAPHVLIDSSGRTQPLDALRGARVAAFCGIGNPAGFAHTLAVCGYEVANLRDFPDHHAFARDELEELGAWATKLDAAALVCTHKDLVKIGSDQLGGVPLWAVSIGLEFISGQELLEARLLRCVPLEEAGP